MRRLRRKTAKISQEPDDLFFFLSTIMRYNTFVSIPPQAGKEETKMANEKILVVDDDKNICELLRLYLVKEATT